MKAILNLLNDSARAYLTGNAMLQASLQKELDQGASLHSIVALVPALQACDAVETRGTVKAAWDALEAMFKSKG